MDKNIELVSENVVILANQFNLSMWNINKSTKIYKPVIFYRNPEKVEKFLALYPDMKILPLQTSPNCNRSQLSVHGSQFF